MVDRSLRFFRHCGEPQRYFWSAISHHCRQWCDGYWSGEDRRFKARNVVVLILTSGVEMQIVGATANATTTVIGGMTLLGFGTGLVFVGYAGIAELLPNKWRYATFSGVLPFPTAVFDSTIADLASV